MARYELHVSDIRTFKSCRRKWHWASPLRRNLEPQVPYVPFFTGRAIHHALEHYYRSGTPFNESLDKWLKAELAEMSKTGALWPQEKASFDDQISLIRGILNHYKVWVDKDTDRRFSDANLEFTALETEFSVPLYAPSGHKSSRIYLAGRFDGLIRLRSDGTYWIWETKTTRSIEELTRSLQNDEQCGAYLYAAQQLFRVPIVGVLYNVLRKKVPTEPQVLQNGELSKNKNIDTTAEMYLDAVKKHHPNLDSQTLFEVYGPVIQHLLEEGNKFFARIGVYRTPKEIEQLQHDLWTVGLEMSRQSTPIYPSPGWMNCNFCQFKAPCLAMNSGADSEFLLNHEYRTRTSYTSLLEAEEESNGQKG